MELAENQSCSAPSSHTVATSVESRLYPNKRLRATWNVGRLPRPHTGQTIFNVGSSVIAATGDHVDLSVEFFCDAPRSTGVTHSTQGSGTGSARSSRTQGRHAPAADFGDQFLPALHEDGFDLDDISTESSRQPCLHREHLAVGTNSSRTSANVPDLPVTWPDINTIRSRRTVEPIRRTLSQEERTLRPPWWLEAEHDRTREVSSSTSRPVGRLMSMFDNNFVDDVSSSSSSPAQTVRLHRTDDDEATSPGLFHDDTDTSSFNDYFTSAVIFHSRVHAPVTSLV